MTPQPENILLEDDGLTAVIADFGLGYIVPAGQLHVCGDKLLGTASYFAPEVRANMLPQRHRMCRVTSIFFYLHLYFVVFVNLCVFVCACEWEGHVVVVARCVVGWLVPRSVEASSPAAQTFRAWRAGNFSEGVQRRERCLVARGRPVHDAERVRRSCRQYICICICIRH